MIRSRSALALFLVVLMSGLAVAQAPGKSGLFDRQPPPDRQLQSGPMYEDIEVLRRLLTVKLHAVDLRAARWCMQCHGVGNQPGETADWQRRARLDLTGPLSPGGEGYADADPQHFHHGLGKQALATHPFGLEGVYLKGQGVVYTATMPPPGRDPRPEAAKPADKPLSDWERVRKELRNEKAEPVAERKEPTLADVVLKVLADNGRHFAQLPENESITVVLTFREVEPSAVGLRPAGVGEAGSPDGAPGPGGGGRGEGSGSPDGGAPTSGGGDGRPSGPDSGGSPDGGRSDPGGFPPKAPSSVRDYELLGDLHVSQGSAKKAIDMYSRALELKPDAKQATALQLKIAHAYLTLKDLDKGAEWLKRAKEGADKVAKPEPAPSPLPAKLIVSAPKKLLDQAGAGKITFEEFKKAATVDYQTFPAAEKKPAK